jgi:TetR/AcrR family transcriptional regulator, cholesterol catabolism regulator
MLDVATELFARRGYEGTSVRAIADEMGIESGSLYSHIASKEEILLEIVERTAGSFFERAEEVLAAGGSSESQLVGLARAHLTTVHEGGAAVRVYYGEWRQLDRARRRKVVALRERYEAMFREVIEAGIESGEFKPLDLEATTLVIMSVLNWSLEWYTANGRLGPKELADDLLEVVLAGLRA